MLLGDLWSDRIVRGARALGEARLHAHEHHGIREDEDDTEDVASDGTEDDQPPRVDRKDEDERDDLEEERDDDAAQRGAQAAMRSVDRVCDPSEVITHEDDACGLRGDRRSACAHRDPHVGCS